ncbi:MAG: methyltransferase domain-containing protein [Pseudomonadota bacterium]
MPKKAKKDVFGYGICALRARHPEIRKLKRLHSPSFHGYRVWTSSWLLMDFLERQGLKDGTRVMDLGCGWGLAGIYCAKNHSAEVTGVDLDSQVFPYLHLHAQINSVKITTVQKDFDSLTGINLEDIDVLIGADICFWDTLADSLRNLIYRALDHGVKLVVIADPGRPTFNELGQVFVDDLHGEISNRAVIDPHYICGRILKIGSLCAPVNETTYAGSVLSALPN